MLALELDREALLLEMPYAFIQNIKKKKNQSGTELASSLNVSKYRLLERIDIHGLP